MKQEEIKSKYKLVKDKGNYCEGCCFRAKPPTPCCEDNLESLGIDNDDLYESLGDCFDNGAHWHYELK